ncbi:MAG: hypothetical protein Q8Q14_01200 [Gemmatimonadales bacterium]|nr:hypothetical protein [Gemmatimonadales bacterium]
MAILASLGSLFIPQPWLALIPALGFGALYRWSGRKGAAVAGGAWLLYAVYESALYRRWLCSGECNIRVDLLFLYPALLAASLIAAVSAVARRTPRAASR